MVPGMAERERQSADARRREWVTAERDGRGPDDMALAAGRLGALHRKLALAGSLLALTAGWIFRMRIRAHTTSAAGVHEAYAQSWPR